MPDKYHVFRNILIAVLLPSAFAEGMDSAGFNPVEKILEVIQNCMVQSPTPWPEEWKKEYLETIRSEIERHRDVAQFALRLKILREGFEPCWESLRKNRDRPLFEVYRCRMRWYVEHLMGTTFPTEEERKKLRNQFTDIWNYATDSLLTQFPFLDPNAVQKAKHDDLNVCYRKIDAPLIPVYLCPMTDEQVEQIRQHWDTRRYARVDLWRRLGGGPSTTSEESDTTSPNAERDYQLTKESLSQLLGLVWMVVPQRPDYYLDAMKNQVEARKQSAQVKQQARSNQQRLERTRSRQLPQIEHISFLFTALLKSQRPAIVPSNGTQEQKQLEKQEIPVKGGDAYELENISKKSERIVLFQIIKKRKESLQ